MKNFLYNLVKKSIKYSNSTQVSEECIETVSKKFGSMIIPENFTITVPVYGEKISDPDRYAPTANPQSRIFCDKLG